MKARILVVDDSLFSRRLLACILRTEGYDVVEADNGERALDLARSSKPDLILLDVQMPHRNGLEICGEIRGIKELRDVPVIFVSSDSRPEDVIGGLERGGADYITKPFHRGELLARVKTQLEIRRLTLKLRETNRKLLSRQRRIEEDLKAAAQIQRALLPSTQPESETLRFAWAFHPCHQIGGDTFNFFPLDEEHWVLYMLDVSGHGVPSAMVAVSISQVLLPQRGLCIRRPPYENGSPQITPPSQVLEELDRLFPMSRFGQFFTLSYHLLHTGTGVLRYSNAGHPPPLLVRADGCMEFLEEGGTVIGLEGILAFREGRRCLKSGDRLILYTDGILECPGREGEFFGKERLVEYIVRLRTLPLEGMVAALMDALKEFGYPMEPKDDITLVAMEFQKPRRISKVESAS